LVETNWIPQGFPRVFLGVASILACVRSVSLHFFGVLGAISRNPAPHRRSKPFASIVSPSLGHFRQSHLKQDRVFRLLKASHVEVSRPFGQFTFHHRFENFAADVVLAVNLSRCSHLNAARLPCLLKTLCFQISDHVQRSDSPLGFGSRLLWRCSV
jgi:hypothetical protein